MFFFDHIQTIKIQTCLNQAVTGRLMRHIDRNNVNDVNLNCILACNVNLVRCGRHVFISQTWRTHLTGIGFDTKIMPSKMKSLKRLEFQWLQFRGVLKQHVTGRYILRVLTVLGLIVVGLCIRRYLNQPVFFTSAIGCKSKIAQVSRILWR